MLNMFMCTLNVFNITQSIRHLTNGTFHAWKFEQRLNEFGSMIEPEPDSTNQLNDSENDSEMVKDFLHNLIDLPEDHFPHHLCITIADHEMCPSILRQRIMFYLSNYKQRFLDTTDDDTQVHGTPKPNCQRIRKRTRTNATDTLKHSVH